MIIKDMRCHWALGLLTLTILSCGTITIGESRDDFTILGDAPDPVPSIIYKYIRLFHDYPQSGEDVVSYMYDMESHYHYKDAFSNYEYDSLRVATKYAGIFLDRRNVFDSDRCLIRSGHIGPRICVKGNLSVWQQKSYDLFCNASPPPPALFDKNGNYLWPEEEGEDSLIFPALSALANRYNKTVCFKAFRSYDDQPSLFPYRIRVRYNRKNGLQILQECPLPNELYFRSPNSKTKTSFIFEPASFTNQLINDDYRQDIIQLFDAILKENEMIETIDCFIPVYYDRACR